MQIPGFDTVQEVLRLGSAIVYRGRRRRDQQPVLLKAPLRMPPGGSEIEALEREFAWVAGLPIVGVPQALDLVRGEGLICLVLADRGLVPLVGLSGARRDLGFALRLGGCLCVLLDELHQRDIIHGGVSPAGILVSDDGDVVELADFSTAARSAPDVRATTPVGAAAYRSPEQTGRMNRAIDYRTDFYSLGATLYELLTGAPPFVSDDPLELIHAHLAKTPASPSHTDAGIPEQVSRIIMRLLAKAPEDRYQSAHGIAHDLGLCERDWRAHGTIPSFPIGQQDVSARFLVSQRLYGREREVGELLRAFDETCDGRTALMLVAGYSGIGKTSLIHELYKPIVRQRGYFIAGKFDQVVRNIPYGALAQALRSLVWQILTESESRLAEWRARLSGVLGVNGGVLVEVIPEIELVIGPQPPPSPLEPTEARNRFGFVFQGFLSTLAAQDHPLVVFLDDLQWADAATLDLLHALLTSSDIHHLLIIGAYRDNEVDAGHLLTWQIGRFESSGARVHRLSVPPLALPDLVRFLVDTLHGTAADVDPLARLILQKTDGNPFFVIQFLKALEQEGFFTFDRGHGMWTFRMERVAGAGLTDNVIDLMTRKIRRLSAAGQAVVTLAACIGNQFDWNTFLTVSRQPADEADAGLAEALDAGLLHPVAGHHDAVASATAGARYGFLHDRVQQAAYELIPESQKHPVHLDVGRLLLAECGADVPDERIFEIVNHMNVGSALITDPAERVALARLNLAAGRKAKASAAYQAAAGCFEAGIALLAGPAGRSDAALAFALHLEAAESQYLTGAFDRAEAHFHILLERADTPLDRAQVHSLRVTLYENQSRWSDAVSAGRDGLALFGISFPETAEDTQTALDREVEAVQRQLGAREIRSLIDLPVMTDANARVVMRLLTLVWAPAYVSGDALLARLMSATMVRLSLTHGHTEDSAFGYATHAITIGPFRRDYRSAYEWGELALSVNDRFNDAKLRAKVHQQFQAHVNLWRRPFSTCIPHAREACRSGLEAGDFVYAGYGAATEPWSAWLTNRNLDRFVRDYTPTLALLEKVKMADFGAAHQILLNWARALQGRTSGPMSISDAAFDEHAFVATYEHTAPFFLTFVYTAKLHLAVMHEQFGAAIDFARRARAAAAPGTIWPVVVDFWGGLALAAVFPTANADEQRGLWAQLLDAERTLRELAENCPDNFQCWSLLLSAEMKRVTSQGTDALRLCEEALAYARQTEQLQYEALANELCARIWMSRGQEAMAGAFMSEAHRGYSEWGASAKVAQLEARYGQILTARPVGEGRGALVLTGPAAGAEPPTLDMASVLKVAQAISVEIELDGLLRKLMTIALENAGAERGLFLRDGEAGLVVEAEAAADPEHVDVGRVRPLDDATRLSHSVVRYVHRTGQAVVVGDAAVDERFAGDAYIGRTRVKSILCVPVGHQGRLGGILYLENNLTAHAFTPDRTEMVRVVAAQTAISLENARLYADMKSEVGRRTLAEQALRQALAELEVLKNRLEAENVYLQEEIRTQHNFNEIVGNSPALLRALHQVERVAPTESTVIILGETGSGKELFARAIHSRSRRNTRPLVKVNCGAIAPGLVESELFGHVKGAFTGAIEKRVGRFEVADGGTIFLDEIGELPLEAQVKLLRVLQEQEFEPVGSSRTVRVSVRVIAATNRNLEDAVRDGKFRADLLYRLNVFPIEIPPLRARQTDIRLLVGFLMTGLERKLGKPIQGFSARSMARLVAYSWPGNVRELQNVVERAAILSQGPVLELGDMELGGEAVAEPPAAPSVDSPATLADVQRAHILNALKVTRGVVEGSGGAATILGLHPNTLRSRMKKLGISTREAGRE